MAKTPTSTTFIFADRRRTGRGKSLNNRQKLLKRIKDSIKNAKPEDIGSEGVRQAAAQGGGNTYTNPVKVARAALSEPIFHYDPQSGEREIVLIGNDHYLKGDEFLIDEGEGSGGGNGSGPGEETEDDFIINISRSEFFDVFFEDCELPDLKESHEKDLPDAVWQRAGYQKVGSPGQLSVIRSFKLSKARRLALTKDERDELELLEKEKADLEHQLETEIRDPVATPVKWIHNRLKAIDARRAELEEQIRGVTLFENVDLRYRKHERIQVKESDAVLIMIMDVSGSMDEDKKRMARKFFALLYVFILRKYPQTDLIYIAHTDEPHEMPEEEFFSTRLSGGTIVSPAWALAHQIIKERYDATQTNIYIAYAGDGDNWESDNPNVVKEINDLSPKIRHAVYMQVGLSFAANFGGGVSLWSVMDSIAETSSKLGIVKIENENEVFDAFKSLYGINTSK